MAAGPMKRNVIIGFVVTGIVCIVLAVAVASIGTQLDEARLEREDLQFELEDLTAEAGALRTERDSLQTERDTLKTQADEQVKAIEQLKDEMGRVRSQAQGAEATATP